VDDVLLAELVAFEENLRRSGAYIHRLLRPGLSIEQILALTEGVFDHVPAPILTWFGWHDGAIRDPDVPPGEPEEEAYLPNLLALPSLAEALEEREDLLNRRGPQHDDYVSMTYQPSWLPLVSEGNLCFAADLSVDACSIHDVDQGAGGITWDQVVELSPTTMVRAWNDNFANGNYRWLPDEHCWDESRPDAEHSTVV
jgi:hypothetical protein